MKDKKNRKSFWTTLPGIITAIAAVITAIGGLIGTLYAVGVFQSSTQETVTSPSTPPSVITFNASQSIIEAGESCTLSWDVDDATRVTINPGIGDVELTGNRVVSPTVTTTYTLIAQNEAGIVDRNIQVTVTPITPPPVTPPPSVITAQLPFVISESGQVSRTGYATSDGGADPTAGDWQDGTCARGLLSFDLSIVPDGATVQNAILTLPETYCIGDPFGDLGIMTIEAVWYDKVHWDMFDTPSYMMISSSVGDPGVEFDITNAVLTAIQRGYTRIQIRFRFSTESNLDGAADIYIIPIETSLPIITIEYSVS